MDQMNSSLTDPTTTAGDAGTVGATPTSAAAPGAEANGEAASGTGATASGPMGPSVTGADAIGPGRGRSGSGFRLVRSREDRMIAGVCGGLAHSLGVDANLLRLGLVALTLLGAGIGVILYIAAWILAPEA